LANSPAPITKLRWICSVSRAGRGFIGVASELRYGVEHRQGQRQQGAGAGEILGAQAGLRGLVAGQGEFGGRAVRVRLARLHRALEQGELLGEFLTLEVMHAQVGERVGQQGARHRGRFGETDRLVQQRLRLEVLAGAAQGDREVQQRVDDQAGAVASGEAAHVQPHPLQLDRLRELPLRAQVGRVGVHHVVERAAIAELGGLHRLVEVGLRRGHVAGRRGGEGLLEQFERVRRRHDRPTMGRWAGRASPGRTPPAQR